MKRAGNIFDKLVSMENLRLAFEEASRSKNKPSRRRNIEKYSEDLENNLLKLQAKLKSGTYIQKGYKRLVRKENNKMRTIDWSPDFEDNIVQHAIEQTAGRVLSNSFIRDTYSGIRKRGIHDGFRRMKTFLSEYPKDSPIYVLKGDIHHFYQSVDLGILKQKIRRKIKDTRALDLMDRVIDSHPEGLPIGNYISQLFANFYLSDLDHKMNDLGIRHYLRYCDDFVVLSDSKEQLKELLVQIKEQLIEDKLDLKPNVQIFPIERNGIDFLGYVFKRNEIRIRKRIERNFRSVWNSNIDFKNKIRRITSYLGWLSHTDSGRKLWESVTGKTVKEFKDYVKHSNF